MTDFSTTIFIDLDSKEPLSIAPAGNMLYAGNRQVPIEDGVIRFLEKNDDFYEGSYLNRIKYVPRSESFLGALPLWFINSGYLWEVRKQFKPGARLIELGCASGVDYFGKRYEMIGLDLSFQSLRQITNYKYVIQADATKIPLADQSVDGIISSYFWEHIPPKIKDKMLVEFLRVLKPGGKLVFLYDVETDNGYINTLKKRDGARYQELFLDGDGHFGYETPRKNQERFEDHGFVVEKHFGMERSWLQSASVYVKFSALGGLSGLVGKTGKKLSSSRAGSFFLMASVRLFDQIVGRFIPLKKARIIISIMLKKS